MIALAIVLGIVALLALMPVGVRAVFDGTLTVYLTVFGISFRIYPSREKDEPKPEKKKKKKKKTDTDETDKPKFSFDKSSLGDYLRLLTQLLGKLRRKLTVKELTLHAIFGGSDPELNYGRAWAAIGVLMPLFEQLFRIRKRDVGAYFDQGEENIRFYARLHATLILANLLHIALHALRGYLKIQKNTKPEKAVQTHEQSDQ